MLHHREGQAVSAVCPSCHLGRLYENHQSAAPLVLPFGSSGFCRDTAFFDQLPVCLIQADHRAQRIVRTLVHIQNVLHSSYKLRPRLWDAPFFLLPRLKFVFLVYPSLLCLKCCLPPQDAPVHLQSAAMSTAPAPPALLSRRWL